MADIPLWQEAQALHNAGDFDGALEAYDKLLTQNRDNAGLLATVGTLYLQMGKSGLGMVFLHRSIENTKKEVPSDIYCNLALAYKYAGLHEEARRWFDKSVKKNPTAETLATYASLYVETGEPEKGEELCRKALAMDSTLPFAHWNYSLLLLEHGQWEQGWKEYDWGFQSKMRIDRALGGRPRWDGKSPGTVAVYGEQGIGDEIMFASMIPDLMKTNKVILESYDRLENLFSRAFGCEVYGTREDQSPSWVKDVDFDYQISIGSLGQYFRNTKESFPGAAYLKAEATPRRGNKFRVGISWTGGAKAGRVLRRSIPLSWWTSILGTPNCEFVSLQYTDCEDEIKMVEGQGYEIIQTPLAKSNDYYDTACLVKSCDLVISCCTSVIHLAGALGVPCWVMTPKTPAWRYQNSGRMPWYRSVRLYRQGDEGWPAVITRIARDLSDHVYSKEKHAA